MGANHTTLSSTTSGVGGGGVDHGEVMIPELLETDRLLSNYTMDHQLYPGSGRMMRTFRLKHKGNGSTVVVKSMLLSIPTKQQDEQEPVENAAKIISAHEKELERIQKTVSGLAHIVPFMYWSVGTTPIPSQPPTVRPIYLVRPHIYTTLSDRLASRPFLTPVEKLWICYQLLQALHAMHSKHIVHGFLTTENVGLSSWNYVVLVDIASYKARVALPDDDPSEYVYYFQELHKHGTDTTPREKRCYLAPERFYTPNSSLPMDQQHQHQNKQEEDDKKEGDQHQLDQRREQHQQHNKHDLQQGIQTEKLTPHVNHELDRPGTNDDHNKHNNNSDCESNTQQHQQNPQQQRLTPAMDIFSAGCVIMETFLNGERALDLGDLMEYREQKAVIQRLHQKLNKIEFSTLRAACRHMLHLDPTKRLSANAYLERLQASELVPTSFVSTLTPMMEKVTYSAPDARIAIAAAYYSRIIWETMGIRDVDGTRYLEKILGSTMISLENNLSGLSTTDDNVDKHATDVANEINQTTHGDKDTKSASTEDLLAETEALLKKLESSVFDEDEVLSTASKDLLSVNAVTTEILPAAGQENENASNKKGNDRSPLSQSSLLIYLQLILSTVRHVQRPATKLVALQLMERLGRFSSDEARLQRIVPVTVSLLQDQDPMVRASAVQVLALTLSMIETFPPSDSKIFPQYIFKRVAHMITDPSLIVRLTFARSVGILAETSHRFLDISHAVRLYEAVGGGSSGGGSSGCGASTGVSDSIKDKSAVSSNVFTDDVTKLLDASSGSMRYKTIKSRDSGIDSFGSDAVSAAGKTLVSSTYNSELAVLHETVSRWVVHITTDQSEHSSPLKRALLCDMARLCTFFGLDGVMAFVLPQLLSFLNDRKDWQLRASLFECLPSVCHMIGRAATEHYVLPCLETALVDGEELVISRALRCLSELLEMGLLSRSILIGSVTSGSTDSSIGLLKKYGTLLIHPSSDVRSFAIATVNASCKALGFPDGEVFVIPLLRPYLRFQPSSHHLTTPEGLERCLHPPWTRKKFQEELAKILASNQAMSPTSGQWTSIGIQVREAEKGSRADTGSSSFKDPAKEASTDFISSESETDVQTEQFRAYLQILAKSRTYSMPANAEAEASKQNLHNAIEGPLKLAQNIMFPRQDVTGGSAVTLPSWYNTLRTIKEQERNNEGVSESASIRSVSALGQVYGLSIMDQSVTANETIMTSDDARRILDSKESKTIEAACTGEWGSETCLDPVLTDTSLLVTKLNALGVPPLPPRLGEVPLPAKRSMASPNRIPGRDGTASVAQSKQKIDTMIASSSCSPDRGHTAPVVRISVAHDQRFFVTGSHDGTCRVWELDKAEKCSGVLESSITYSGHRTDDDAESSPRVNDVVMVENSHSAVSGASDGSVHVWRVDTFSASSKQSTSPINDSRGSYERSRVVGSSEIRQLDPDEGEILTVNHFNTPAASILLFGTQKGYIHSWDLRCAAEPFVLQTAQGTGYLTSMALGTDRNWLVTGTSRGFLALWDLRFQQILKLWQHSRAAPINRLATSIVPPPQTWVGKNAANAEAKPFIFAASGPNECAMFDVTDGSCRECFRTVDYGNRNSKSYFDDLPVLNEVPMSSSSRRKALMTNGLLWSRLADVTPSSFLSVNAMVGSIGASDSSFLITGGTDCRIRYWDFCVPSRCYVSSGQEALQHRPSFERIDSNSKPCRLMLCRQTPGPTRVDVESSRVPRKLFQGLTKPENYHQDSIQDLKIVRSGLVSCSRDCTVKLWR